MLTLDPGFSKSDLRRWAAALVLLLGCGCAADQDINHQDDRAVEDALQQNAHEAELSEDFNKAATSYRRLYEIDPNDQAVALALARNLRLAGRPMDGLQVIDSALRRLGAVADLPQLVPLLIEQGKAQVAAGRAELALPPLVRAATMAPNDWEPPTVMGVAYDRLSRFAEAETSYRHAMTLAPDNADVLNNYALSKTLSGDLEEGLRLMRLAAGLPNAGPKVRENLVLLLNLKREAEGNGRGAAFPVGSVPAPAIPAAGAKRP